MGTRRSLRAWQAARGLVADGYLSHAMVYRLKVEASALPTIAGENVHE
jgi:peptidoglycan hydrolase-like protein with peptidoglycan-binding domain